MLAENYLPFQMSEFSFLSVPDLQPEMQHDVMDHDASSMKSAGIMMEQDPYVPVNYISPEVFTLLAAAKALATRCADAMDASVVNLKAKRKVHWTDTSLSSF